MLATNNRASRMHKGQATFHPFLGLPRPFFSPTFRLSPPPSPSPSLRPFFTAIPRFLSNVHLKSLERLSDASPSDPALSLRFLTALSQANYPAAVVRRFETTQHEQGPEAAMLYVEALQQIGSGGGSKEILDRLRSQGTPAAFETMAKVLGSSSSTLAGKGYSESPSSSSSSSSSKGSIPESSYASSSRSHSNYSPPPSSYFQHQHPSSHLPSSLLSQYGSNPSHPLYVSSVGPPPVSPWTSFWRAFRGLGVAFLVVTAVAAFLDEKGLGKLSPLSGSGNGVNEAEVSDKTFDDVLGCDEAKEDLVEIVAYLKDPAKFTRLGAKLPRGVLLTGPPGTGKTLLAKAIAGEAGVPFFYASGSAFEEVYVGVGARRVRDLFEAAKKKSPCIIFIDEIDAIGGSRQLKDQSAMKMTLNELLVQMDGFAENAGIIIIGATNFASSLDKALTRPGRFDKKVSVALPDVLGRVKILEHYAKKTIMAPDVDLNVIARGTPGMSGAELYNVINQASLKASIDGLQAVTHQVLEWAKDKIQMGAERKSAVITAETARLTAFHEAGHALVAMKTEGASPVHLATIMPRGDALGLVYQLPKGDQSSLTRRQMIARLDVFMGGRVAEELVFGPDSVSSGASSDIQQATNLARAMVSQWGFSDAVGKVYHDAQVSAVSDETRVLIDKETRRLIDESYSRVTELLKKHSKEHERLSLALIDFESLTGKECIDIVEKNVRPSRKIVNTRGGAKNDVTVLDERGKVTASAKSA